MQRVEAYLVLKFANRHAAAAHEIGPEALQMKRKNIRRLVDAGAQAYILQGLLSRAAPFVVPAELFRTRVHLQCPLDAVCRRQAQVDEGLIPARHIWAVWTLYLQTQVYRSDKLMIWLDQASKGV